MPVATELRSAGFEAVTVSKPDQLEALLAERRDIGVAILDGETDFDQSLEYYSCLRDVGRAIPALMVVSPRALDRLTSHSMGSAVEDEYFTRPYSAESIRWRVEAMLIRSQTIDDGSGPVLQSGPIEADGWSRRATIVAIFNPKGGVGKTTVATNLASTLQIHKGQSVLLVDADTVTGHVTTSLGIEAVRTVADSWLDQAEGGPSETVHRPRLSPSVRDEGRLPVLVPAPDRDPGAGTRRRCPHGGSARLRFRRSSTCIRRTAS